MSGNTTSETLDLLKSAQGSPADPNADVLAKAGITQALGLVQYDLQRPALSLFPVLTPLRNMIPRVQGNGGTATNWKEITGINTASVGVGVSEGNRGGIVTTTVANRVASYAGIGLEDYVTFEADYAAAGFQDVKATAALNLLRAVMIGEEAMILGGDNSLALGTTPTPTLVASASGGTIPASYVASVIAVALTLDGFNRSSVAGGVAVGPLSRTNADGSVDTFGPGVAQQSAAATVTVSAGATNSITASVVAVPGAVAYAWYFRTAGIERIVAITTAPTVVLTAPAPTTGQLASALPASDQSLNTLGFDGFLTIAMRSGSGAYIANVTTTLTSDGAGGIVEINTALRSFWDNRKLSPDILWVSAQQAIDISNKVVANGGAPLIRLMADATGNRSNITSGFMLDAILNKLTGTMVTMRVHPNMPSGTMLFTSSTLPYPLSGVSNVYQIKTRREYYQLEWPLRTRKYEYGVYADELLQVYAPFSLGVISGVVAG